MALTNDECPICGAPYHMGRDPKSGNKKTLKLSREAHLAFATKKKHRRTTEQEAHVNRLLVTSPIGAVRQ